MLRMKYATACATQSCGVERLIAEEAAPWPTTTLLEPRPGRKNRPRADGRRHITRPRAIDPIYCDKAQPRDLRRPALTEWLEDQLEKVVAAAREARSTFKGDSPIFLPALWQCAHDASIMCQPGEGDKG